MKLILTIAFNAVFVTCFAQRQLDLGKVKPNNNLTTVEQKGKSICKSSKQLEIALTRAWPLMGNYETVTLTFDGWKWAASKLKGSWRNGKTETIAVRPILSYDSLFSALKSNNIFLLDDQDFLKLEGTVDDGTEYSLSYKAGNYCRSYQFRNPDEYKEMNKQVAALTNYVNIAQLLFEGLREQHTANAGLPKKRQKS